MNIHLIGRSLPKNWDSCMAEHSGKNKCSRDTVDQSAILALSCGHNVHESCERKLAALGVEVCPVESCQKTIVIDLVATRLLTFYQENPKISKEVIHRLLKLFSIGNYTLAHQVNGEPVLYTSLKAFCLKMSREQLLYFITLLFFQPRKCQNDQEVKQKAKEMALLVIWAADQKLLGLNPRRNPLFMQVATDVDAALLKGASYIEYESKPLLMEKRVNLAAVRARYINSWEERENVLFRVELALLLLLDRFTFNPSQVIKDCFTTEVSSSSSLAVVFCAYGAGRTTAVEIDHIKTTLGASAYQLPLGSKVEQMITSAHLKSSQEKKTLKCCAIM